MNAVRRGRLRATHARASAPARRFVVAWALEPTLLLTHQVLEAQHFRLQATGPTGVRFYRYGTWVGAIALGDFHPLAPLLPEPLRRATVSASLAVEVCASASRPGEATSSVLTVAGVPADPESGACVIRAIDAIGTELAHQGALIHAEPPTSTYDLDGDGIRPARYRPPRRR